MRDLGAGTAIDYKNEWLEDLATDIDAVFDLVAGETQGRSRAVLREAGSWLDARRAGQGEGGGAPGALHGAA